MKSLLANKLDKNDPNTRMDFLDNVVRRHQGRPERGMNRAYQILNSTNPTLDDLVDAWTIIWGFDSNVQERLRQQLIQIL